MKTQYFVKEKVLYNSDLVSPLVPYAAFSAGLGKDSVNRIVATLNYGGLMMDLYARSRDNLHILAVTDMLKEMEDIYTAYKTVMYESTRK